MAHHTLNRKYTLLDRFYFDALSSLTTELSQQGIPYVVGGGTAVQLHIAHILGGGVADIKGITGLDVLLRETGDVDLATLADEGRMVNVGNSLAYGSPFAVQSLAGKRLSLRRDENVIFINYETGPADFRWLPDHYGQIIETAEEVSARRRTSELRAFVPRLEYCLALKLLRLKPKDQIDIINLTNICNSRGVIPNLEEVRSILKSVGKEEQQDYLHEIEYAPQERRFLSLDGLESVDAFK